MRTGRWRFLVSWAASSFAVAGVTFLALGAEDYFGVSRDEANSKGLALLVVSAVTFFVRYRLSERKNVHKPPVFRGKRLTFLAHRASGKEEIPRWGDTANSFESYLDHCVLAFRRVDANPNAIEATLSLITDRSKYLTRLHEIHEPYTGHTKRHDLFRFMGAPADAILPLLFVPKTHILDELSVDLDTKPAAPLDFREVVGLTHLMIRKAFNDAFHRPPKDISVWERLDTYTCIGYAPTAVELEALKQDLVADLEVEVLPSTFEYLLDVFSTGYFILARPERDKKDSENDAGKPIAEQGVTMAECTYVERVRAATLPFHHPIASMARSALTMTDRWCHIPLTSAASSRSLHVTVHAPEDLYIHTAVVAQLASGEGKPTMLKRIWELGSRILNALRRKPQTDSEAQKKAEPAVVRGAVGRSETQPRWPSVKMSDGLGLQQAHAYARDLDQSSTAATAGIIPERCYLSVEFRDRPPGILLPVLLCSLAELLLVGAIVVNFDLFRQTALPTTPFAAILALPVVLCGWVVSKVDHKALRLFSFPTVLALLWFIFNSLLIVIVGSVRTYRVNTVDYELMYVNVHDLSPHGAFFWFALAATCGLHVAFVAYSWVARASRYRDRVRGSKSNATMNTPWTVASRIAERREKDEHAVVDLTL